MAGERRGCVWVSVCVLQRKKPEGPVAPPGPEGGAQETQCVCVLVGVQSVVQAASVMRCRHAAAQENEKSL